MRTDRKSLLLAAAGAVVLLAAISSFWPDGLITLDFTDAPVQKVIASIERQGRVRIGTNVPPETAVTIHVKKVPLMDALETLSVRFDGDLRVVFAGAATKDQAAAAIEELKSGKRSDQWAVAWAPGGGMLAGDAPPDPRTLAVKPEAGDRKDLQSALRQVTMKSGLMTAVPRDWNPDVKMPTKAAPAASIVRQLIGSSGGQLQESFLIVARGNRSSWRDGNRDAGGAPDGGGPPGGTAGGGGQRPGREGMNPDWMAQRAEAAIAQLPPEERKTAQADLDATKKFFDEVRALPEDQRRTKIEEYMNRPEVQDKMAARQDSRDTRQSPQQREQRMRAYLERKQQMLANPPKQ